MRRHLRLVSSKDPENVFDDLSQLQEKQREPVPAHRARVAETFARIPHDQALTLRGKLSGDAWLVLIDLDRIILKHRGQNPVKFVSSRLRTIGLKKMPRSRALLQLKTAGVIKIEHCGQGLAPWVTHLWYPLRD